MSLSAKLRRAPLRAVTGAYVLQSGVGKLSADDETAKKLHGMASGTYGFLGNVQPRVFVKGLAIGEMAVGSALLLPIVPPVVAGAALAGFSGALLNVYWRTPGLHQEGDPRPTAAGVAMSKDVWMFGIGTGLMADALLEPAHDKKLELTATAAEKRSATSRRAKRKAAKTAAKAAKAAKRSGEQTAQARAAVAEAQDKAAKRAEQAAERAELAAEKAQQRLEKASEAAAKRMAELRKEYGPVAVEKAQKAAQQARDAARNIAEEYGPLAAEKAKHAADAARNLAEEYGSVAAEKAQKAAQQVREAAQETAARAKERVAS